ncbi:unnamed protein product [Sphagnum compactum]
MAIASDADPEQDFCVADPNNPTIVNGLVCKNPALVKASDFVFHGLATPGNTHDPLGSFVTPAAAAQFPGINTLGISMARLDFAKGGLVPPHTHPRATEIIFVVEGSLFVGFVSTNETLFATTLQKGDVFVFPRGLLHFELNVGNALLPMMAIASDADPEQDFCVADPNNPTIVNGLVCKNPALVKASDFVFHGLATPGNTNDPLGSSVTPAAAAQFPGINTLGISMARLDFAKGGLVPPHTHPRATEIIFVVEGSLFVGFVSTNGTLFATTLQKGDVFVFPRGLLHFELNVWDGTATAIAALNSQNPGTQIQAVALFNSGISEVVLEKAFGLGEKAVQKIEYAVEAANKKP